MYPQVSLYISSVAVMNKFLADTEKKNTESTAVVLRIPAGPAKHFSECGKALRRPSHP